MPVSDKFEHVPKPAALETHPPKAYAKLARGFRTLSLKLLTVALSCHAYRNPYSKPKNNPRSDPDNEPYDYDIQTHNALCSKPDSNPSQ